MNDIYVSLCHCHNAVLRISFLLKYALGLLRKRPYNLFSFGLKYLAIWCSLHIIFHVVGGQLTYLLDIVVNS